MKRQMGQPETPPVGVVTPSSGSAAARMSYVHFCGVAGGIVGSLLGYTLFDVGGALVGGFLGILACELAARRALRR